MRSTLSIYLPARATLASCYSLPSGQALTVSWSWEGGAQTTLPGYSSRSSPALTIDSDTKYKRRLQVKGEGIHYVGIAYAARVTGCVPAPGGGTYCGSAATKVALLDEPLQGGIAGGDRTVGRAQPFALDACASMDPDDKIARCNAGKDYCGTLQFAWTCMQWDGGTYDLLTGVYTGGSPSTQCLIPRGTFPPVTSCQFKLGKEVLPQGKYTFQVCGCGGGRRPNARVVRRHHTLQGRQERGGARTAECGRRYLELVRQRHLAGQHQRGRLLH